MGITADTMLVRTDHAAETTIGEEVVLMTIETGECLGLSETGSAIWRLLAQRISFASLVEQLLAAYEGDQQAIERGARAFVEQMVARGLILAG